MATLRLLVVACVLVGAWASPASAQTVQPVFEWGSFGTAEGQWVRIRAKPEPLLSISAAGPLALLKLAWHLGNRHTPAAVEADRILIRPDHVLAAMVTGLGGAVAEVHEPFQPEGGAYGDGHGHGHGHDHGHGHSHD